MLNDLRELRRRLLAIALFFCVIFVCCFYASHFLLSVLLSPLRAVLSTPQDAIISTRILAPLFTPLQLAFDSAICCTLPVLMLNSWRFIAPGLYRHERRIFARVLIASLLLFVLGGLFCFYLVLPNLFYLVLHSRPAGVLLMPDMTESVQFIVYFLLLFGGCFQLPLLCLVLVYTQLLSVRALSQIRPYVIVAAFIIGMLLTPPDVLSQIMLALPLCFLYELGLLLCRLMRPYVPARAL